MFVAPTLGDYLTRLTGSPTRKLLLQVAPITAYWWQLSLSTHGFWQASVQKKQSTYWYPDCEARQAAWQMALMLVLIHYQT